MNIQDLIARRAKQRGWDATWLAAQTGLSQARVQEILDGAAPTHEVIAKFRDATIISKEEADAGFKVRDKLEERGLA